MSFPTYIPPRLYPNVSISPLNDAGDSVVKNPRKQSYLKLGERERFILEKLDGSTNCGLIMESYQKQFGEELNSRDLDKFLSLVRRRGLVEKEKPALLEDNQAGAENKSWRPLKSLRKLWKWMRKQSPLFFRVKLVNPDRVLNWLEPKMRWLFTWKMAAVAALGFILAMVITWTNRDQLITLYTSQLGWQPVVFAWITLIGATICHEFGHGLACKRYGGEVREMGILFIFFTPCLYCNVSDAWLLPEKWKRILISMAGTYVDLLIWVVAVVLWSTTSHSNALNYIAWIIVTTCGLRVIFNINPFMKMDGYYTLSDLLEIHNLKKRSRKSWMAHLRWLLWGAPRPKKKSRGNTLLWFGMMTWVFKVSFIGILFLKFSEFLHPKLGTAGLVLAAVLFVAVAKRYVKGFLGKDFADMLRFRKRRALILGTGVLSLILILLWFGRSQALGFLG